MSISSGGGSKTLDRLNKSGASSLSCSSSDDSDETNDSDSLEYSSSCSSNDGDATMKLGGGAGDGGHPQDLDENEASNHPKVIGADRENIVADMNSEQDFDDEDNKGVMSVLLQKIHDRLRLEYSESNNSKNKATDFWLKRFLSKFDFWINEDQIPDICQKLDLTYNDWDKAYYTKVRVWLPDKEFNIMPPCINCGKSKHVQVYGWRDNHVARRICSLTRHYYIISRRYICIGRLQARASISRSISLQPWYR
jgi:hypothetical protein